MDDFHRESDAHRMYLKKKIFEDSFDLDLVGGFWFELASTVWVNSGVAEFEWYGKDEGWS